MNTHSHSMITRVEQNIYTFNFPDHWLHYTSESHSVALRRISVKPASRDFSIKNMYIASNNLSLNASLFVSLANGDDMITLNDKLNESIRLRYSEYMDENHLSESN